MFKKITITLLLAVFLFSSLFVRYAYAVEGSTWYNQGFGEWTSKVFDKNNDTEIFGERYTFAQVSWIIYSLASIVIGTDLLSCVQLANEADLTNFKDCLNTLNPVDINASVGSAAFLAYMGDNLSTTRLASGVGYFKNTASKLRLIPEVKAQGTGFQTLQPIQKIWKAVRNAAYLLMIIVVIAMAFMIMFRVKISPQTIVTIQSALPKVIMTLVLITFSYAIAGLIIDLSYLFLGIFALMINQGNISSIDSVSLFNALLYAHPLLAIFLTLTIWILLAFIGAVVILGIASLIPGVQLITGGAIAAGGITFGVLLLLFGILILIISIRIWWLQLKTFINVALLIIIGPLIILFGAATPNSNGFGNWLKSLIANIAVFPVIIILAFLAHFFFWGFFLSDSLISDILAEIEFLNPFHITSNAVDPGQIVLPGYGGSPQVMGFLAAFGILFLIPSAANLIKSLIESKPFSYGTAIGESLTAPFVGTYKIGKAAAGVKNVVSDIIRPSP